MSGEYSQRGGAGRRVAIRFAALMRWLHIYLSMLGLAAVLFFSLTGITLNHPDWLLGSVERTTQDDGRLEPGWLRRGSSPDSDSDDSVARLEVVEFLRKAHRVRGALTEFRIDPTECTLSFKSPGYEADAFIDRDNGRYTLTQTDHGWVAIVNDLHKGRDSGRAWSILIDLSAALMAVISLTGLVLLFYLKQRRGPGLLLALLGTIAVALVWWLWVP